jgi:hypothetical protein
MSEIASKKMMDRKESRLAVLQQNYNSDDFIEFVHGIFWKEKRLTASTRLGMNVSGLWNRWTCLGIDTEKRD